MGSWCVDTDVNVEPSTLAQGKNWPAAHMLLRTIRQH